MGYSIYVNEHNSKATIHDDDCKTVRKNGGTGKGYWVDGLNDYEEASDWIKNHLDSEKFTPILKKAKER